MWVFNSRKLERDTMLPILNANANDAVWSIIVRKYPEESSWIYEAVVIRGVELPRAIVQAARRNKRSNGAALISQRGMYLRRGIKVHNVQTEELAELGTIDEIGIADVLDGLSERQNRIVSLYVAGHTMQEIADIFGTHKSTVSREISEIVESHATNRRPAVY